MSRVSEPRNEIDMYFKMKTYRSSRVYDINAESIGSLSGDIVSVNARNEDFSLMVVNKQASDHVRGGQSMLRLSILKIYLFMLE